jgi:hypothetical protein
MAHLLDFERTVNFILLKKRLEQYLHLYCYCIPLLNGNGSAFPLCWTWAAIGKLRVAVGQAVLRAAGRKQALKNWREKDKFQQEQSAAIGAFGNSRPCGRTFFCVTFSAYRAKRVHRAQKSAVFAAAFGCELGVI